MVLINKRLAMCLVRTELMLFLTLGLTIVHGFENKKLFTTKPKAKEIFVGDSVTFDWDFTRKDLVTGVQFGIVRNKSDGASDGATEELSFLSKKIPNGVIYLNQKPKYMDIIRRIEFVDDKRASFRISNVRMNDTGKYFCKLKRSDQINRDVDYVDLKVVDLQVDEKASSSEVESWKKLKTPLVCMVRVAKDEPVTFTWLRQPNNQTLSRGMHIDARTESILTIITSADYHFTTYTCVAKTKQTTKLHNIVVKRLYGPGAPLNLQKKNIFDKVKGESFHRVYWSPPKDNGGAKVTDYIIEYKPRGISWSKATRVMTKKTMYEKFNLKEGKLYDVRVLARNKVDEGKYSNEVEIKLPGGYPSTGARSNSRSSNLHHSTWWTCLLSLTLVIAKLIW